MPSQIWIDENGNAKFNSAPTNPSSISVPDNIRGGTNVNVTWGGSTDVDGNLSGYRLERAINNSNSWGQVAQINALSSSQTVTKGWNTVAFRVKAYDAEGAESGYTTSPYRTVVNNVAPTVPGAINVPDNIRGGTNVTVTWGASRDDDGNLSGYRLERAINNTANWTQVAQVNALTSSQPVTKGWNTVAFRVKAYDAGGLESGYSTSPWRTVINNVAPTIPGSITVPDGIKGGSTITVSWAASTDEDGNLSGYRLERSVNGGGWEQVDQTAALSSQQQITKGWNTVAFRVRAYDAGNLQSGYATSPTRTIDNNTPPAISGFDEDLGAHTQPLTHNYTVSDVDSGQTLTVSEVVTDAGGSIPLRTYTAANGGNNTADLTAVWLRLSAGEHMLIITANDGAGGVTTRTLTFTRALSRIACSRAIRTDAPVRKCMISFFPSTLPEDAFSHCEVTNNPFDPEPVWEEYAKPGTVVHLFQNQEVTGEPGLAFRRSISKSTGTIEFSQAVVRFAGGEDDVPS